MEEMYEVDGAVLGEAAYANRVLPSRESPAEVGAMILSAAGIVLGLSALVFVPFKPGFAAIGISTIALAVSGERNRVAKIAMTVSTLGWLVGGLLAVLSDSPVW